MGLLDFESISQIKLNFAQKCFQEGDFSSAYITYLELCEQSTDLANLIAFNLNIAKKKCLPNTQLADHLVYHQMQKSLCSSKGFNDEFKLKLLSNEQGLYNLLSTSYSEFKPLVSVIMPTFNRADFISQSIITVLQQSYQNFELIICDDGSTDNTKAVIESIADGRIIYLVQDNRGAAAARNNALQHAKGELIAYLDSDNYWHPHYLQAVVKSFSKFPGRSSLYFNYIDYRIDQNNAIHLKMAEYLSFDHERLLTKPFIDLNVFSHKRELYDAFGGFDESLVRRQDYDLIIKYTWLRDPIYVPVAIALYQRNDNIPQISKLMKHDLTPVEKINRKVDAYLNSGLPLKQHAVIKKVSVIIWDICRNHFSKPFSVAEALAKDYEVELISFDFFDEGVFEPLKEVNPAFTTKYFKGADFPDFLTMLRSAMDAVTGDVMYVVKPRLPSLGLALLVNAERAIPFCLEINDLETVVNSPTEVDKHFEYSFDTINLNDSELNSPYSLLWSQLLDPISKKLPVVVTHNTGLDSHYAHRSVYMRNLKDEQVYNPGLYNRNKIRAELGFKDDDRIILFGGLIRKHKGIFELIELLDKLGDPRFKLLFVGSRPTPDQKKLVEQFADKITVLPPQDREGMARINFAADLVILWLNPDVAASHYQFPYKASDAFAMNTPVIANDISDLGDLGRQGYLTTVPFGDWEGMVIAIKRLFSDDSLRLKQVSAARRLYQRQFSFNAARANFELIARRLCSSFDGNPYPVAVEFAKQFSIFSQLQGSCETPFCEIATRRNLKLLHSQLPVSVNLGEFVEDESIFILDASSARLALHSICADNKVAVVMLCSDIEQAILSARMLVKRAEYSLSCFVLEESKLRNASLTQLTHFLSDSSVEYVLFVDEHVFPCRQWLQTGYEILESKKSPVLFANTGAPFSPDEHLPGSDYFLVTISALANIVFDSARADLHNIALKIRHSLKFMHYNAFLLANLATKLEKSTSLLGNVHILDVTSLQDPKIRFTSDICVVMPCIRIEQAFTTVQKLQARAGIEADYVIAVDSIRQGFIKTLNCAAQNSSAKYIVYLAEDAHPGFNWLKLAYEKLERTRKGLLAFNCGKWFGRVAAFGMVRVNWVRKFYETEILHEGYRSHRADNELTVLARADSNFAYTSASVLFENDRGKDFKKQESEAANFFVEDKMLFIDRYYNELPKVVDGAILESIHDEYLNQRKWRLSFPVFKI